MNKKKAEQIKAFNGIAVIDEGLLNADTLKADLEQIYKCLSRFLNYDFGALDPEQTASNNKQILLGKKDFFGSYDIPKGRLSIALFEGKYRFVYEERT